MSLHNEIMNIQVGTVVYDLFDSKVLAYKCGHRDARHAAAELSLKYERYISIMEDYLDGDSLDEWRKECGL